MNSLERIGGIAPGLGKLLAYRRQDWRHDVAAGLSVAAVALPVGVAYAQLAGFNPVTGLYASILPLLAYALFGTSRQLVVGPDDSSGFALGCFWSQSSFRIHRLPHNDQIDPQNIPNVSFQPSLYVVEWGHSTVPIPSGSAICVFSRLSSRCMMQIDIIPFPSTAIQCLLAYVSGRGAILVPLEVPPPRCGEAGKF